MSKPNVGNKYIYLNSGGFPPYYFIDILDVPRDYPVSDDRVYGRAYTEDNKIESFGTFPIDKIKRIDK